MTIEAHHAVDRRLPIPRNVYLAEEARRGAFADILIRCRRQQRAAMLSRGRLPTPRSAVALSAKPHD